MGERRLHGCHSDSSLRSTVRTEQSLGSHRAAVRYLSAAISSTSETVITSSSQTSVNIPTASISNVVLSNNLATIVAQNTFVPGMVVEIEALANATFLNGESLTILNATPNGFTSQFTAPNYGNTVTATVISGNVLTVTTQNSYTIGQ